jgi:hypothetical protein
MGFKLWGHGVRAFKTLRVYAKSRDLARVGLIDRILVKVISFGVSDPGAQGVTWPAALRVGGRRGRAVSHFLRLELNGRISNELLTHDFGETAH